MTEREPEFVIDHDHDTDDDHVVGHIKKEAKDLRLEKLSTRVTLITIIVPILIGAILYLGYVDISEKVKTVFNTGTNEVNTLSKDLESKFSNLSIQISKIEEGFNKQYQSLNVSVLKIGNSLSGLEENISRNKKDIDYLAVKRKKFEKEIATLTEEAAQLKTTITETTDSLSRDLAELTFLLNNMKKEFIGYKTELKELNNSKADKALLGDEIKQLSNKINMMSQQFENKIKSIEKKIDTPQTTTIPASPPKTSKNDTVEMIKTTPETPPAASETSGGVIEQDIPE